MHRALIDSKAYYKYMINFHNIPFSAAERETTHPIKYKEAKGNIIQYLTSYVNSWHNLLYNSFTWQNTAEGYAYWRNVAFLYLRNKYTTCKTTIRE